MAAATATKTLAEFAAGLRLGDVPEAVRHKAKLHILDTIGCGLAGTTSPLARQLFDFVALEHRTGPCPVLGTHLGFGPAAAAFANAGAMNALDFDDGFDVDGKGMGHPGATIVAAAVSGAHVAGTTGADALCAVVAAYEINNRLIWAIQPSVERHRHVYGVCQHQTIPAAVAYGRLRGLSSRAMENAFGLAATMTPLPSFRKYNWERRPLISFKDFSALAAETGTRAVELDELGLVGSADVLDGPCGFWRMIGSDQFDPARLLDGLGSGWTLSRNSIKPYPACRLLHTVLEALEQVLDRHALTPDRIAEVVVHTSGFAADAFMDKAFSTMVDAQNSFPYVLAAAAHRVPYPNWYDAETLARDDLRAFARRVQASVDPEADALMSGPQRLPSGWVEVSSTSGDVLRSAFVHYPRGGAMSPLPEGDVLRKFERNVEARLGPALAAELAGRLMALEDERSFAALTRLCAPAGHRA